mgnify:CR=1 FL=1
MEKIELINLTLDEIRKACTTVNNVCNDTKLMLKGDDCECLKKLVNNCNEVLESIRVKLREALEEVANYQDATDMVCPVDMALSEVAFDLIYERKDEYDFEEEQV